MTDRERKLTFHQWYVKLANLAEDNNCPWLIPPEKDYPKDGYEDGLSAGDELSDLISYSR